MMPKLMHPKRRRLKSRLATVESDSMHLQTDSSIAVATPLAPASPAPSGILPCDIPDDASIPSRIVSRSDDFFAAASLGPLAPGHLIVCPYRAFRSIGDSIEAISIRKEFGAFVQTLVDTLRNHYATNVVMFEHGNASFRPSARCGVEHAHLHLLPTEVDIGPLLNSTYFQWIPIAHPTELVRPARQRREYLYYSDSASGRIAIISPSRPAPSQFFRQLFAAQLGILDWDWKRFPRSADAIANATLLRKRFH